MEQMTPLAPVFKWPGGKRALVREIEPLIRRPFARLVEPFCGGAALFFHLRPGRAILADRNEELVNAYCQIRDRVGDLVTRLQTLVNNEDEYYRVRNSRPDNALGRATRFIYLMRLSFNGIYRENLRGEFNVPYGYKTWLSVCEEDRLRRASDTLRDVDVRPQTYESTMALLEPADVVYVDPPYTVSHNDNGFIKYNRTLFSWEDQQRLAQLCEDARRLGAQVIVSNANHTELIRLYPNFEYHRLNRFCPISGPARGRRHVFEALLVGKPG